MSNTYFNDQEKIQYQTLKKLECPFTWKMGVIMNHRKSFQHKEEEDYYDDNNEEYFPILELMNKIMTVYEYVKLDEPKLNILKKLDECKRYINIFKKKEDSEISTDVVIYVFQASQCFVYQKLKTHESLLKEILLYIENVKFTSEKDKSTLAACKGICWSRYHKHHPREAEEFIRIAIKENPNCHLWHFILALNLRRLRRSTSINSTPDHEESTSFKFVLNKNPDNSVYEVFCAQMYRESNYQVIARQLYESSFNRRPKNLLIILRLAMGFMRLKEKDYNKAEICLNKAKEINSNHSMYLHYQGVFYMGQKKFEAAIPFYKEAIKCDNFAAEKEYLICLMNAGKNVDKTKYLQKMLNKYETLPNHQLQSIYLDLAFCYWRYKDNLYQAVNYFLKAVKVNPKARCITNYFNYLKITSDTNICNVLKNEFLPLIKQKGFVFKSCLHQWKKVKELKSYCNEFFTDKTQNKLNNSGRVFKKHAAQPTSVTQATSRRRQRKRRATSRNLQRPIQHQRPIGNVNFLEDARVKLTKNRAMLIVNNSGNENL